MIDGMLDLFAGSGVGVAAKRLGVREYGVEIMPAAVETRDMAGFDTPYNDAWDIDAPERLGLSFNTLWGSPPCQTFSVAGKGNGRKALSDVLGAIEDRSWEPIDRLRELGRRVGDDRTALVLVPLAYIHRYLPTYVALEQVPTVLPVWEAYKPVLEGLGYSVWVGNLHSEQYGVPQTRKRAFLIARRDGDVASPPAPTHSRYYSRSPERLDEGVERWVSMRDSLGIGLGDRPWHTLSSGHCDPHFAGGASTRRLLVEAGVGSLTDDQGSAIQTYPSGFAFGGKRGDRRLQIGNAVPPLLAEAVLKTFAGDVDLAKNLL